MDKVSIIIPLHNSEAFIRGAIKSCLDQSYPNIEVVVVENGSTDNSLKIVKALASESVKVFSIGKASATIARNFGFTKATGEYIQYLDADDLLDKDKISYQMKLLQHLDTHAIASATWCKFENQTDEAVTLTQEVWKNYDNPMQWLLDSWMGGGMMQTACWLTHRSLINAAGNWNEDLKQNPNDDGEFFCRVLLNASKIRFVKESKVFYRTPTATNVSENRSAMAIQSLLRTYQSYHKEIFKYNQDENVRKALSFNYRRFIYEFHPMHQSLVKEAQKELKTLNISPLPIVGGSYFKKLASLIGFNNALNLRAILNRVK